MMNRTTILTLLFAVLSSAIAGRIEYQNCEGVTNKASDVVIDVSDCPDGSNCTLVKGTTYYVTSTFTPQEDMKKLQVRILGVMGRLKMPYMGHKSVCPEATTEDGENCDPNVGFKASKRYSHVRDFPVRNVYPELAMTARVEYFTGPRPTSRNVVICYEIPIKIVKPEENEV